MKKTYINPSMLVVRLSMSNIIALSVDKAPDASIDISGISNPDEYTTKGVSDVNIWDEEW